MSVCHCAWSATSVSIWRCKRSEAMVIEGSSFPFGWRSDLKLGRADMCARFLATHLSSTRSIRQSLVSRQLEKLENGARPAPYPLLLNLDKNVLPRYGHFREHATL